jgi:hypothetical protein
VEKLNHSFAPPLCTTAITYPLMAYAYEDSNSSGEHFDSTPPATNDEYESDTGATFFVALKTWTLEQKRYYSPGSMIGSIANPPNQRNPS